MINMHTKVLKVFVILHSYQKNFPRSEKKFSNDGMTNDYNDHSSSSYATKVYLAISPNTGYLDTFTCLLR